MASDVVTLAAGEGRRDPSEFFTNNGGIIPSKLAAAIQRTTPIVMGTDQRLYRYDAGVYRPDGATFIKATARELLGDRFKARHSEEAIAWCSATFPTLSERPPASGRINVANGLLDPKTGVLEPHSADFRSTIQLPVAWVPSATCRKIEKFLSQVLPDDAVEFVFELLGYLLFAGNPLRIAVLLLGPGRNGKSVLLRLIEALLGSTNVAHVPLQALTESRFAAAQLFGKLANICGDLDARAIKQTDVFKMVVGGDTIEAERKHRDPFTFTPFAIPIFSANEAPLSSDQSQAWFDRWVIVPMEHRIPAGKIDPALARKLTCPAELEGLLAKAVAGMRQVMGRGQFDFPASIRAAGDRYRDRLDTVRAFVAEQCVLTPNAWTPRPALYRAYREHIQEGGRFALSAVTFNEHLTRGFGECIEPRTRHGDRGWAGIGLREQENA